MPIKDTNDSSNFSEAIKAGEAMDKHILDIATNRTVVLTPEQLELISNLTKSIVSAINTEKEATKEIVDNVVAINNFFISNKTKKIYAAKFTEMKQSVYDVLDYIKVAGDSHEWAANKLTEINCLLEVIKKESK